MGAVFMPEAFFLYVVEADGFIETTDNSRGIRTSVPDQKSLLTDFSTWLDSDF